MTPEELKVELIKMLDAALARPFVFPFGTGWRAIATALRAWAPTMTDVELAEIVKYLPPSEAGPV